jgi:UDP-GlcNAc:undecaprenyl-phosphate GlcNAc-1-phosphate transferase
METIFTRLLLYTLGGFIAAYICNLLLLNFSQSLGIRNKNDVTIRWSNQSKPSLGGISFFVVFIFASFSYAIFSFDEYIFHDKKFIGLFVSGTLAFLMGLADDAYNTKPLIKLSVQILCGVIFIYTDTVIEVTSITGVNYFFTIFWVILLMNSLNMLDNMDGITGTVVLFIIITCLGSKWILFGLDINFWFIINSAMIGGLLGFLYFNIHPSKLFMGDAGSQFIGLYIAFITIDDLWMVGASNGWNNWIGLFLIAVCFTAPFSDTLSVVINRLKKGQSPMVGGKDHTTHHLVYAGLNDKQVWYVFLSIAAVACILTLSMIYMIQSGQILISSLFIIYTVIVFFVLYRITLRYHRK